MAILTTTVAEGGDNLVDNVGVPLTDEIPDLGGGSGPRRYYVAFSMSILLAMMFTLAIGG